MGVPKFFRYTSERYPCLNELVKPYQIPDFDNMYLDMNGIIHNCSHPDDSNPHFRITEEQIFKDIFHYLSILFQIIKPKKLFFMAIDGVAPRAKMNQQRGRRFRSAKDAEKLEQQAREKGEVLPQTDRFDSNCITPGTPFMARLHEQLKYFVKDKITNDPMWAKVKVVLSGHETPGEGEHKIMDYIRWARSQPDYNPNTRHCLYGLDADLIMLGMCTHEPHFALLREEVKFGKSTQRATSPEDTNFYLLQLSLLREYLEQDFLEIKDKLSFRYDIENIVDDWVLMGFLVGNDFIPNLPNMHINNGALPLLYKTYMKVLPTLDGYINESGDLHLGRFEAFMTELAKIDREKFQETYADVRYFEAKTGRRPNANERREYVPNNDDTFNVNIEEIKANKPDDELQALINATYDMLLDDNDLVVDLDNDDGFAYTSDEEANFNMEFRLHKSDYYINKMDYADVTEEVLVAQAQGYVRAIQWNLLYYYKGCPSWSWYYPHHYAPYISDIKGFSNLNIEFELGEPFKPFEQLLGVLPAASKQLLPEPFHHLMTSEDSPISSYYPVDFETDLNGKQRDWEAVVLIPFIDEKKLLAAMAPCYSKLTPEEKRRNQHGPMLIYNRSAESQGPVIAPEYFPSIRECHATETRVWREQLIVPPGQLVHGMLPTVNRDMMYPGFPTTRHLKYETYIKKCKVKVFDQPSFNENMIMKILPDIDTNPPLEQVANEYLGKIIWVGWPHLTRAKVISVSNEMRRLHLLDTPRGQQRPEYMTEINEGNLRNQWVAERQTIVEHNMRRLGIEVGSVHVIIHAINLRGYKYLIEDNLELTLEPEWCVIPCGYALQAVVKEINTYVLDLPTRYTNVEQAFPPGDNVFLTTPGPYYGSNAKIVECSLSGRNRRVKVCVCEHSEPLPRMVPAVRYSPANHAAATAGITPQVLSRLTGCVLVITGGRPTFNQPIESMSKLNLGLNLKFNKKNQEVSGYTRRTYTNMWTYSERCVRLIIDYVHNFPEMISNLGRMVDRDVFFEEELWPGEVGKGKPQEVQQWLNKQSHTKAAKRECGSEALEAEECRMLADDIDNQIAVLKTQMKKLTLQVKLNLLYKPELHEGNIPPDPKADYKIYDRVICTANNITVPIGARGTVTAVHRPSTVNNVRLSDIINSECTYQVMFDNPFPGAMHEEFFDTPRFYRMSSHNLLNISYGRKIRNPVCTGPSVAFIPLIPAPVPNILRREDGHNSAFASYSPTRERQAQNEANNMNMPPPPPQPDAWRIKHEMNNQQNLRPQPGNWSDGCNPPITGNRPLEEECYQNMPQAMPVPPYPLFDHPDQMQAVITETPYVQVVPTYTVGLLINQPPMPGPPHSLLGPPPNHGQYLGNNQNNQTYSQVPMHNQYISTPAYTQGNVRPAQVPPYQYQPPPFNNGQYPTPLPQPDAYNVPMNNRINQTPQTNQVQKPNNQRPNQGRWTSLGHRVNQQINQAQKLNQHMHMGQQVNMGQQMQPNMGQQMHPGRQMNMGQQMTQGPRMHPGQQMKMSQQMTQGPQMHPGQQMKMSQQMTQGSQMHPGQQMNMGQQMNRGQMHPGQQINNTINPMDVNLNRPKDLGLPVNQTPGVNHSLIPNANQVPLPNFQINQDVKHKERKVSTDASFPKTPQVSVNNVPANMPVEQTNTTNAGQNKTADTSAKNAKPATSATTPFVPLQVQASRRRSETSEFRALGSIQKKMTAPETKPAAAEIKVASMEIRPTAPIPKPAPPPTEWIKQQSESANNNAATSPKDSNKNNSEKEKNKKRKSRLAIDLPFKTE